MDSTWFEDPEGDWTRARRKEKHWTDKKRRINIGQGVLAERQRKRGLEVEKKVRSRLAITGSNAVIADLSLRDYHTQRIKEWTDALKKSYGIDHNQKLLPQGRVSKRFGHERDPYPPYGDLTTKGEWSELTDQQIKERDNIARKKKKK